jgi:hypothetical protein
LAVLAATEMLQLLVQLLQQQAAQVALAQRRVKMAALVAVDMAANMAVPQEQELLAKALLAAQAAVVLMYLHQAAAAAVLVA